MNKSFSLATIAFASVFSFASLDALEYAKICALATGGAITYGILNDQVTARLSPEYFSKGFHFVMRDRWKGPVMGRCKRVLENTQSPTVVGIVWGTVATWWMGALLSVPVMLSARAGSWPQLGAKDLLLPTGVALAGMGAASLIAGVRGYTWAKKTDLLNDEKCRWHSYAAHGAFLNGEKRDEAFNSSAQRLFKKDYNELTEKQQGLARVTVNRSSYIDEDGLNRYIAAGSAHQAAYASGALAGLGIAAWALAQRYSMS